MNVIQTEIPGVVIIEPRIFADNRGYFYEAFTERDFAEQVCPIHFVQQNEAKSSYGVVRGLHFQLPPHAQSKLVRVTKGRVLDVVVDIRRSSPTFGKHIAVELSDENHLQLFIPRGFAHGYSVLSDEAVMEYKCDNYYAPESEGGILPKMEVGDSVIPTTITAMERYSVAPTRYNEAALVKRLEELGIGRPSTYAPTISTIITRGYVEKSNKPAQKRQYTLLTLKGSNITEKLASENYGAEKNRLAPTDIGMVVNDYLEKQFAQIMDYNFTASVEKEFDHIANGEMTWRDMINRFYDPFHSMVDKAIETQTNKDAQTRTLGIDPESGMAVKARIGRYGPMVEIEAPEGDKPQYASLKKGQLIESITLEEALELFALPRNLGKFEGHDLMVGIGKFGAYVRYGNSFASLTKSDDPYTIQYERAVELIQQQKAQAAATATPLKSFEEDKDMVIRNGRYGAYIAYKGKNYRLPAGRKPEEMTYEECQKIVARTKK